MTNGEKLCIDFPNMRYTISGHRVITTIGIAASFDLDWWNAEYKEPIDKIDCDHTDCINCVNHKYCDYEKSSSEIPNKSEIPTGSTTKNDLGVEKIEVRKPCINYEDGCEEWAGCPCVHYKGRM